jgi:ribosomal RNA-processing protein 12
MLNDLISTLVVFVTSNNREIVKSSLGFVKVIAVTLSAADVRPHLPALVPGLLAWSHDHKNHFKGKVRHIFERLIRKFGYDEVVQCAEGLEGDGVKFLENIKKRKERSKRKKAARSEGAEGGEDVMSDDDGEPSKLRNSTGNAFEDALYGSDSDISDSDDEAGGAQRGDQRGNAKGKGKGRDKNVGPQTFIREDGDEPMDLLDRTLAGRVTSESHTLES